jgi:hypothetical protein
MQAKKKSRLAPHLPDPGADLAEFGAQLAFAFPQERKIISGLGAGLL